MIMRQPRPESSNPLRNHSPFLVPSRMSEQGGWTTNQQRWRSGWIHRLNRGGAAGSLGLPEPGNLVVPPMLRGMTGHQSCGLNLWAAATSAWRARSQNDCVSVETKFTTLFANCVTRNLIFLPWNIFRSVPTVLLNFPSFLLPWKAEKVELF